MGMKSSDPRPKLVCGESRTKQEFAKAADINNIMRKYRTRGALPLCQMGQAVFQDVSNIPDFAEVQRRIARGKEAFMRLPAVVRNRFENDASKLVEFLQDEGNREEAEKLGLLPSRQVVEEPAAEPAPSEGSPEPVAPEPPKETA